MKEEWKENGPEGAVYSTSPSGWMETENFLCWFNEVFLANTRHLNGNRLLFLDGHVSHMSIELIQCAIENKVTILSIPAHTSHVLQPLDVGVFKEVKSHWAAEVSGTILFILFK